MKDQFYRLSLLACILSIAGTALYLSGSDPFSAAGPGCARVGLQEKKSCYSRLIRTVFEKKGLPAALDFTASMSLKDPVFTPLCHNAMHDLGKSAYRLFKHPDAFEVNSTLSYCNYGFYHAFIEEMLKKTGGLSEARAFCSIVGETQRDTSSTAMANCYHGIGHGISSEPEVTGNPDAMIRPGLAICRTISINPDFTRSCAMGVFNSLEILYHDPRYKLTLPENAYSLCGNAEYTDDEKKACYLQMTLLSASIFNNNLDQELAAAITVEDQYRPYAVKYVALFYAGIFSKADETIRACRGLATQSLRDSCVVGVADSFISYGIPDHLYDKAVDYYRTSDMNAREKNVFLDAILRNGVGNETEQSAVCRQLPEGLRVPPCKQ